MNALQVILVHTLAVACLAATPVAVRAAVSPAAAAPQAAVVTNASNVPHATRRLEEDELRSLLTAALNQRRGEDGADWELSLTRPWTPITVPDGPVTLEIVEPSLNRMASTCLLKFELRAAQKPIGSWHAPVQAHLWRPILVARTALHRGQLLREDDFVRERHDLLTLREPLAEFPSQAVAYELAETVPAGAPLTARAIRLKPVLSRGQIAEAIIRDGAMSISLKVEVLEEGAPGQVVRVRNPQSHRELRGKVLDEQSIAITL